MQSWYWLNQKKWCFKWAFVNAEFLRWAPKVQKMWGESSLQRGSWEMSKKGKWGRFQGRWVSFLEGPFWGAMSAMLVVGIGRWVLWWLKAGFHRSMVKKRSAVGWLFWVVSQIKKDFEMWESWCFGRLVQTKPYQKELSSGLVICCI